MTIRVYGRGSDGRQRVGDLLARAFEHEGVAVRTQPGDTGVGGDASAALTLLVDIPRKSPGSRPPRGDVAIQLDSVGDLAGPLPGTPAGALLILNASATPPGESPPAGDRYVTRCDASCLASCFGSGGDPTLPSEAIAAAIGGAFAAATGYVRLRTIVDLVRSHDPDLRDVVVAGFMTAVGGPADDLGPASSRAGQ